MLLDENQLVQVKWSGSNKEWYTSRGYVYTKQGDIFDVKAKDLPKGSNVRINVICDICGKEYGRSMKQYNNRPDKTICICKNCKAKKMNMDNRIRRAERQYEAILAICNQRDYGSLMSKSEFIDKFVNINTCIEFLCKKHGIQTMTIKEFLRAKRCHLCSWEELGNSRRHDTEYIKSVIESYNGNEWLNPDEYIGATVKNLKIKCGLCGQTYVTSFNSYATDSVAQRKCFSCSCRESKGEVIIRKFLEDNHIAFEREKSFFDCRDVKPLPFDFYLSEYNLLIEFDGQHHFENRGFGNLEKTQRHDRIKNEYCKLHNINLLRIPYWQGSQIENIISKQLNL